MIDLKEHWAEVLPDLNMVVPFDLRKHATAVFLVGSHSHGTWIAPTEPTGFDDLDLMVVCVPPPEFKLGLKPWDHASYKHGKWDVVLYDWQKWLGMLRKSNPNVLGTLWCNEVICPNLEMSAYWDLRDKRGLLLSRQMYPAFVGYARGQMHKMTHHVHQGYMGEKRTRLVEQFGYDVKNAAHLVRLLRMACETLETGRLNVYRMDAKELVAIKQGKWSLEQVREEADRLFARAEVALASTNLQEYPDDLFIQKMMVAGYAEMWNMAT